VYIQFISTRHVDQLSPLFGVPKLQPDFKSDQIKVHPWDETCHRGGLASLGLTHSPFRASHASSSAIRDDGGIRLRIGEPSLLVTYQVPI
jgi:hypothetical protein